MTGWWDTLFGEVGMDGVLEAFRGGEPFVVHGERERLPGWMNHDCLASVEALSQSYTGRILYGRRDQGPRSTLVERGSAADLLAAGEALYLPDVSEVIAESDPWLRQFESFLGIPTGCARATAWAAPAGEGTAVHLDAEDVVSIQLLGRKTFAVAEPAALPFPVGFQFGPGIPAAADLYPQAADGFPQIRDAVFTPVELVSGSVLVLARGHWHHTRAPEVSLSLSIIMTPPTRLDWALAVLRHGALQDIEMRRPLYGAATATERARCAAGFSVLAASLAQANGDADFSDATTVQGFPSVTVEHGDGLQLHNHYDGSRRALELTPEAQTLLAWWGGRSAAFTVADARAALGPGVEASLGELVQEGVLYRWPVPMIRP